ncbi:hypothetical protein ACSSS7_003751 [Eimeria intestinalis]
MVMRSACLSFVLWPCLTLQGTQALSLPQGHLSKSLSENHTHGYTGGLAAHRQLVPRLHDPQASGLEASDPFSAAFLQSRPNVRRSTLLASEAGGSPLAARPAHKRLSAYINPSEGGEESQGFKAVRQPTSAFVQSSPDEGDDSSEEEAPEGKEGRRSGGTRKRIRALGRSVGRRVTGALQAARRAARRLQHYLVAKVKKLLQRLRSSHDSASRGTITPITGGGYGDVARAVARAPPKPLHNQPLRRVKVAAEERLLNRYMPKNKWLVFASLKDDRTILFERHEVVGAGPFGMVIAFLGDNGIKLAGKIVTVQENATQTQLRMQAQLQVLEHVPAGEDIYLYAQRNQLALPYDVLRLRNTDVIISIAGGEDLVNALIMRELFESDAKWLFRVLSPTRPEDIPALISVTQQAVFCISNLHKMGLLHLDIKPENFLVGGDGRVFASDFGLKEAGFLKASLKYSPQYAAPELAQALTQGITLNITQAADSWSLGVTLYELWCRKLPYRVPVLKSPTLEMVAGLTEQSLNLDEKCFKNAPPEILELIKQFLRSDPTARLTPIKAVESHPALVLGATKSEKRSPE